MAAGCATRTATRRQWRACAITDSVHYICPNALSQAAAFGYALMGDRLSAAGLVGCALIFVSMLGVQLLPLQGAARGSGTR